MITYTVAIHWSKRLVYEEADSYSTYNCLYLYEDGYKPMYVGEAGYQTVAERIRAHRKDGVVDRIWKYTNVTNVYVKIGFPVFEDATKYSAALLHDVQTLIIYLEATQRDYCKANIANTVTRDTCRPGMVVKNQGDYFPLVKTYKDQPL